jgi:RNA polymerase sigma factor (sigma-70 family)
VRFVIAAVPSIGRAVRVERQAPDADATQDLYERYAPQIFGFCVNQLGSRDEAEDAVQTTFLNAHRALQRGVTPDAELPWLYKIAHNVCLTRRRSARRRVRVETPSDLGAVQDVLPAPTRDANDELLRLTDALGDMPPSQRRAILLREWQGLSYHEIADELDLSQSAVETLIFRARRTLASKLRTEGDGPSVVARIRKAFDAGALLTGLKTLLEGGAAAKVAAVAVVAGGATVAATAPHHHTQKPKNPKAVSAIEKHRPAKASAVVAAAHTRTRPPAKTTPTSAPSASKKPGAKPESLAQTPGPKAAPHVVPASAPESVPEVAAAAAEKTPPGQAKQAATEPEQSRGQDKPAPKDIAAEPSAQKPAEPPKADPELPSAAQEHGSPEEPGNPEKGGGPKK